jgi:hypothetical protein
MKKKDWLYWVLVLIAAATVLTGLAQMLSPGFVLSTMKAEIDPTSKHFFGIVGMFMVLFGGLFLNALLSRANHPVAVFWASMQKLGAAVAVGLGVMNHIFSSLALGVAGFDLLSGILGIIYWLRIRNS